MENSSLSQECEFISFSVDCRATQSYNENWVNQLKNVLPLVHTLCLKHEHMKLF